MLVLSRRSAKAFLFEHDVVKIAVRKSAIRRTNVMYHSRNFAS